MLLRGTAVALSAAVLAAGALASCSMGGDPGRGMQGAGAGDEDQDAGPGENPGGGSGENTDGGPGDGTDTGSGENPGGGPGDGTDTGSDETPGDGPGDDTDDGTVVDITDCPYLKIGERDNVKVVTGIYEERLPDDRSIAIPDGVELDQAWCDVYDESGSRLRTLSVSEVESISLPAGAGQETFSNIIRLEGWPYAEGWATPREADIDIIYRGNLADWCEHGYLGNGGFIVGNGYNGLYSAKNIKINGGKTDLRTLDKITAEDIAGVERIGDWTFYYCSGLTSVEIPDSVMEIGGYAFYRCSGLTSVEIPDSVTEIGDSAVYYCSRLTSVEIPDRVGEIGDSAFYYCSGLTSVKIPDSVTEIGENAFMGCSGLTSVKIPGSVTKIGNEAFWGCSGLTSVEIPGSVTEIGHHAFNGCSGLTSVEIGNGVTEIGRYMFNACSKLSEVEIPDSVTEIGENAFNGCSGLTSVTIGNGLTYIGSGAFYKCNGLTSVTFGEPKGWYRILISSGNKSPAGFNDNPSNNATIIKDAGESVYFVKE